MNRMRDDALLPVTRAVAVGVTLVLVAGATVLAAYPGRTSTLFAWPVRPSMTAFAMAAGYFGGAVFFARAAAERRWHQVALGFLAATLLTGLLLAATFLHWSRFAHGNIAFWVWLVVYLVTPVLLPALFAANRVRDPHGRPIDDQLPLRVAAPVGVFGTVQLLAALAAFGSPGFAIRIWPWALTPLTARVLAAFVAFVGLIEAAFLVERRWSALSRAVDSVLVGLVLVGLGAIRARHDFAPGITGPVVFGVLLGATITWLGAVRWLAAGTRPKTADGGEPLPAAVP